MKRILILTTTLTMALIYSCSQQSEITSLSSGDQRDSKEKEKQKKAEASYQKIIKAAGSDKASLTKAQRSSLYKKTSLNPVSKLDKVKDYDPAGLTGFCFGRAMTAHLDARVMGLKPESVKKLFIVGDLRGEFSSKTEWRFHVTTIVKGDDKVWYAIDPIMGGVMTAEQWIAQTRKMWDRWHKHDANVSGPQSKIYVVDRHAVLPDIRTFLAPKDETPAWAKKHIIALSFNPKNKPGLTKSTKLCKAANAKKICHDTYELTKDAGEFFFLTATEKVAKNRFNYVGLLFSDDFYINYRDYYLDLFNTYLPTRRNALQPRVANAQPISRDEALKKHVSINFDAILKRKGKR